MKIAILGTGNIGGAMARGLIFRKAVEPGDLTLTTLHEESLDKFRVLGCNLTTDNVKAISGADLIVLAVKPRWIGALVREIREYLDPATQTVVCMAAGLETEVLLGEFGDNVPDILFAIPNTAMEVGESMTFLSPVKVSDEHLQAVKSVFDRLGGTMVVPKNLLGAGTALASCGIAYAMRYVRAAALGGVELGFKPADALSIVERTVAGAVKLMREHGSHPEVEIDKVTSPGGITIKGLNAMEEAGFTAAVIEGLKAAK